jgi:5-formyltetrahydrofolate cyclo-ligase
VTQKELLRQKLKAERLSMSPDEVREQSIKVVDKLVTVIDWPQVKNLHIYMPIVSLREVDTWPLLRHIWQRYPYIETAISPAHKTVGFQAIKADLFTKWEGSLPKPLVLLPADYKFDTIIVPALAYDAANYRLGWGGGFYDRFLATQPDAQKIGLCYQKGFIKAGLPREPHDISLDQIITD